MLKSVWLIETGLSFMTTRKIVTTKESINFSKEKKKKFVTNDS